MVFSLLLYLWHPTLMMMNVWLHLTRSVVGYLYRDVRVVSWKDDIAAVLPPLHEGHWIGKDLAQQCHAASCYVHMVMWGHLDDRDWMHATRASKAEG